MTVRKGHVTPKEDLGLLPEFLFIFLYDRYKIISVICVLKFKTFCEFLWQFGPRWVVSLVPVGVLLCADVEALNESLWYSRSSCHEIRCLC